MNEAQALNLTITYEQGSEWSARLARNQKFLVRRLQASLTMMHTLLYKKKRGGQRVRLEN